MRRSLWLWCVVAGSAVSLSDGVALAQPAASSTTERVTSTSRPVITTPTTAENCFAPSTTSPFGAPASVTLLPSTPTVVDAACLARQAAPFSTRRERSWWEVATLILRAVTLTLAFIAAVVSAVVVRRRRRRAAAPGGDDGS